MGSVKCSLEQEKVLCAADIPDIVLVVDARKQTRGVRKPKPKPILLSPSDQHRGIRDL